MKFDLQKEVTLNMKFNKTLLVVAIFTLALSSAQEDETTSNPDDSTERPDEHEIRGIASLLSNYTNEVINLVQNTNESIQQFEVVIIKINEFLNKTKLREDLKKEIGKLNQTTDGEKIEKMNEDLDVCRKQIRNLTTEINEQKDKWTEEKLIDEKLIENKTSKEEKTILRSELQDLVIKTKEILKDRHFEQNVLEKNHQILIEYLKPNPDTVQQRIKELKNLTKSWFEEYEDFRTAENVSDQDPDDAPKLSTLLKTVKRMRQKEEQLYALEQAFISEDLVILESNRKKLEVELKSAKETCKKDQKACHDIVTDHDQLIEDKTNELNDVKSDLKSTKDKLGKVDGKLEKAQEELKAKNETSIADQENIRNLKEERKGLIEKKDHLQNREKELQAEIDDLKSGSQRMTMNGLLFGAIFMANIFSFSFT